MYVRKLGEQNTGKIVAIGFRAEKFKMIYIVGTNHNINIECPLFYFPVKFSRLQDKSVAILKLLCLSLSYFHTYLQLQ